MKRAASSPKNISKNGSNGTIDGSNGEKDSNGGKGDKIPKNDSKKCDANGTISGL